MKSISRMKKCSTCRKTRLLKFFNKDSRYRLGVKGWCKDCESEYGKSPKQRLRRKLWYVKKMRDPNFRESERKRSIRKYNPQKAKDRILRKLYGISLRKFRKTKRCLLCRRKVRRLVADHDHKTNKFRGVLCVTCNLMIAWVERIPSALAKIRKYLERGEGGISIHQ